MSILQNVVGIGIGLILYLLYQRLFGQLSNTNSSGSLTSNMPGELPNGVSSYDACLILKRKYQIQSREKLLELNPSVTFHWMNLKCESIIPFSNPLSNQNSPPPESETPAQSFTADVFHKITDTIAHIRHPDADAAENEPVANSESNNRCMSLLETHHVVPGSSWGTLPEELQREWTKLKCDLVVTNNAPSLNANKPGVSNVEDSAATEEDFSKLVKKHKKGKDGKAMPQDNTALPKIDAGHAEWCLSSRDRYGVQPMKSWGKLPQNMIDMWKLRKCDLTFTAARMLKRPLAKCYGNETVIVNPSTGAIAKSITHSGKLPLIAIMAATTTRKVVDPSTSNMALFMYLLPSLIRTIDCGFRYEYVLGYDVGDGFYDSEEGMSKTKSWFKSNIEDPMKKNGIEIKLRPVRFRNTMKKPGPVFIAMARAAYEAGADYFYRVNDDTELLADWPIIFVKTLHSLPAPYGVVGPLCNQGNNKILTHDFVHRVHMEVFGMNYYPPQLVDWWMDDWISFVYGKKRTFKASSVPVMHHTGAHGQRYEVDRSNEKLLQQLVVDGRKSIRAWMLKNQVPEQELIEFDQDSYLPGFEHSDIPATDNKPDRVMTDNEELEPSVGQNKPRMKQKRPQGGFRKVKQFQ